jgi:hypothetical protein
MAIVYKGVGLGELHRSEEAIAVYDDIVARYKDASEPALREKVAKALIYKGWALGQLNRSEAEIAVYDDLVARYKDASEPALREKVAWALGQLNRNGDMDTSIVPSTM